MASTPIPTRRVAVAIAAGLLWATVDIALARAVMARFVELGDRTATSWPYQLLAWTALAPFSAASRVLGSTGTAAEKVGSLPLDVACCVAAIGACIVSAAITVRPKGRGVVAAVLLAAVLAASVGGVGLAVRCTRAAQAQRAFFALLARADVTHMDAATVSAAERFVARYPDSRWVGEALRIVAMRAWDEGRYGDAEAIWQRFEATFSDPTAPGVAYAELSRGLCDERAGAPQTAERRYQAAIGVIQARGDGIQGWIASDAARRLAKLDRKGGMLATSDHWKTKAQKFADFYSIE